jgi:hypothetical protein
MFWERVKSYCCVQHARTACPLCSFAHALGAGDGLRGDMYAAPAHSAATGCGRSVRTVRPSSLAPLKLSTARMVERWSS